MNGHVLKSSVKKQRLCLTVGAEGTGAEPLRATQQADSSFVAESLAASLRPAGAKQGKKCRAATDEKNPS